MSLKRKVQLSTAGTNLVSLPAEVVGEKHGRPLEATYRYNSQVHSWTIELKERA